MLRQPEFLKGERLTSMAPWVLFLVGLSLVPALRFQRLARPPLPTTVRQAADQVKMEGWVVRLLPGDPHGHLLVFLDALPTQDRPLPATRIGPLSEWSGFLLVERDDGNARLNGATPVSGGLRLFGDPSMLDHVGRELDR